MDKTQDEWRTTETDSRFWWNRLAILIGLLVPFTVVVWLAVHSGSPSAVASRDVAWATAASITGPFVGGISRNGQGCCAQVSTQVALWFAPLLMIGFLAQWVPMGRGRFEEPIRLVVWAVGWMGWFFGGLISLGHALS